MVSFEHDVKESEKKEKMTCGRLKFSRETTREMKRESVRNDLVSTCDKRKRKEVK